MGGVGAQAQCAGLAAVSWAEARTKVASRRQRATDAADGGGFMADFLCRRESPAQRDGVQFLADVERRWREGQGRLRRPCRLRAFALAPRRDTGHLPLRNLATSPALIL